MCVRCCVFLYALFITAEAARFLGCYKDISYTERLLDEHKEEFRGTNTNLKCVEHCQNRDFRYAATEYSFECYCSNTRPPYKALTSDEECDSVCDGNKAEKCGGQFRLTVYDARDEEEGELVGCFEDSSVDRLLKGPRRESDNNTPQSCLGFCQGRRFPYAGLQYGRECFCGDSIDERRRVSEKECNKACSGDRTKNCGGHWRMTVFAARDLRGQVSAYVGCFADSLERRVLTGPMRESVATTPEYCMGLCYSKGFPFAGVQYGKECFCGDSVKGGKQVEEAECFRACAGDAQQVCGGGWRIDVYKTGLTTSTAGSRYLGCYSDLSSDRLLKGPRETFKGTLTNLRCIAYCKDKGFKYAGTEWKVECFCDNSRPSYMALADEKDCSSTCDGDDTQNCGAGYRLSVYEITGSGVSALEGLYMGCYEDDKGSTRVLDKYRKESDKLTAERCLGECYRKGYRFAGVQAGKECNCGDVLNESNKGDESDCSVKCSGDKTLTCGGFSQTAVYQTGIPNVADTEEQYLGCFVDDSPNLRLLSGTKLELSDTNTPRRCLNMCLVLGYKYSGTQYGVECFCGSKRPGSKFETEESQCQTRCPGDSTKFCGGNYRLLAYATGSGKKEVMNEETKKCEVSLTQVKGKKGVCKGQVLLFDDFTSNAIDTNVWSNEIFMPAAPDYDFVVYDNNPSNIWVRNGKLVIKPSLLDDRLIKSGKLQLAHCTGQQFSEECERQAVSYRILPPVRSARLTTKDTLSFTYGKVTIRAKFPQGDWIKTVLGLSPARQTYGPGYTSGSLVLAMARGNVRLTSEDADLSNTRVESALVLGVNEDVKARTVAHAGSPSSGGFRNYTVTWTPESVKMRIDNGKEVSLISDGNFVSRAAGFNKTLAQTWKTGLPIAPFDKEFYLDLRVAVGGMRDFPDDSLSGDIVKPWKNFNVKGLSAFWQAHDDWYPTWQIDNSALEVDFVQVTAL